ncbi:DNA transposition protein [Kaustia mangrovi]|uniref:DNA transposition protein n=1 Tax=Kaustia mangrovi TaxID=2593653 RepID=A0A7S8C771_9HYPH|nr:DNA transposition protein [Kaustia mangrovi]QPC44602.1 DNA transposition protein [Kaustia mangrovi]
MARDRRDRGTLDLLAWEPPELVHRFDEKRVRSSSMRARIAQAVSETCKESGRTRDEIAEAMSAWLGEDVSRAMLDAYASPAREAHTISYLRLLALVHVTGDIRLLQMGAEIFGQSVVEDRWLPWVEVGQLADRRDEINGAFDAARRAARRGARG